MRDGTFRGRLVICAVFECLIDDRSTNPTEAAKQPDDFGEIIDDLNSLTRGRPPQSRLVQHGILLQRLKRKEA